MTDMISSKATQAWQNRFRIIFQNRTNICFVIRTGEKYFQTELKSSPTTKMRILFKLLIKSQKNIRRMTTVLNVYLFYLDQIEYFRQMADFLSSRDHFLVIACLQCHSITIGVCYSLDCPTIYVNQSFNKIQKKKSAKNTQNHLKRRKTENPCSIFILLFFV